MPWHVEYIEAGRVIEMVYTGIVSPGELDDSIRTVLAMADAKSTARMLADVTGMLGGHTPLDLHAKMESALQHDFAEPIREALVLPPKAPAKVLENVEFWVAGLRLRGMDVQIFLERAPALAWLRRG